MLKRILLLRSWLVFWLRPLPAPLSFILAPDAFSAPLSFILVAWCYGLRLVGATWLGFGILAPDASPRTPLLHPGAGCLLRAPFFHSCGSYILAYVCHEIGSYDHTYMCAV